MSKKKAQSASDDRKKKAPARAAAKPAPKKTKAPAKPVKPAEKAPDKATKKPVVKPAKAPAKKPSKAPKPAAKHPKDAKAPKPAEKAPAAAKAESPKPKNKPKPLTIIEPKVEAAKAAKAKAKAPPKPPRERKSSANGALKAGPVDLSAAREAAKRLAAAAGLRPVEKSRDADAELPPEAARLTKSPLPKKELDRYRDLLREKRNEVVGDISGMESEALNSSSSGSLSSLPQHMADQGSDEYDQSLALGLAANQRVLLREIDAALERIDKGEFGICEILGTAIDKERLEATPWTRYSLDGARVRDRQLLR